MIYNTPWPLYYQDEFEGSSISPFLMVFLVSTFKHFLRAMKKVWLTSEELFVVVVEKSYLNLKVIYN